MTRDSASIAPGKAAARDRLLAELAGSPSRRGFAVAYDLLGNRAEAEEAVQDSLACACERLSELRELEAAPAWFLRIVTTTCLRVLRRRRLRRAVFGRWLERVNEEGEATPVEGDGLPTAELGARLHGRAPATADVALDQHHDIAALLRGLEGLPPQQRAALVLRYGHDLPVPEIAAALDVGVATAKTHLVRGLAKLRELMEVAS